MNKKDQDFLVQKIRTQYTEKEHTDLDELKKLDQKVVRPANVFAYTLGSIGAVVMGAGMSLTMTDLGATLGLANPMILGVVIGVVGMAVVIANYPVYKAVLGARRRKYAAQVIALSDKIANA